MKTETASQAWPIEVRQLSQEDGGGWLAEFPDLPGCFADGETPEEAVKEAQDALKSYIETAKANGDKLPDAYSRYSGRWVQRVPKSLHQSLVERAKLEGVSLNTLVCVMLSQGTVLTISRNIRKRKGSSRLNEGGKLQGACH